jgi:hypothetical protein
MNLKKTREAPEKEREHSRDDRANTRRPKTKKLFLPLMSASLPIGTRNIAVDSKNAVVIHTRNMASISNSLSILGRARFTEEPMNGVRNDAMVDAISTSLF